MSDDLITWLRARLDEDEEGAMNAQERYWRPAGPNSCEVYVLRSSDSSTRTIARCRNGYPDDFANSLHVARHDPARVLYEVEAKRRILDYRDEVVADQSPFDEWAGGRLQSLDRAVTLLALPYADQPGYREEWRP